MNWIIFNRLNRFFFLLSLVSSNINWEITRRAIPLKKWLWAMKVKKQQFFMQFWSLQKIIFIDEKWVMINSSSAFLLYTFGKMYAAELGRDLFFRWLLCFRQPEYSSLNTCIEEKKAERRKKSFSCSQTSIALAYWCKIIIECNKELQKPFIQSTSQSQRWRRNLK